MRHKIFVFLGLMVITMVHDAEGKTVRISTLTDYAPFCMVADTYIVNQVIPVGGDAVGFRGYSWDVLRESFHEMGYTIHLSITPWARAMLDVKNGTTDLLFPTGKNTGRKKIFLYSDESINEANYTVYVRADSTIQWNDLESLNGLTIGMKRGFNYGDRWEAATGIIKYDVATIAQGFNMMIAKRLDGFVGYEYNWDYYLKEAHLSAQFKKFPAFGSSAEYVVALKRNPRGTELINAFDAGKKRLIQNGKLDEIKRKWFGTP